MFKRLIDWHLMKWKDNYNRKPLLIRGARQIGKTYAVRKLANSFENMIEVNFELAKDSKPIFEKNLDPQKILRELSLFFHKKILLFKEKFTGKSIFFSS